MTMPISNPAGAPIPLPSPMASGTLPSCPVRGDMAANEMNRTPPSPMAPRRSLWTSSRSEMSSVASGVLLTSPEPRVSIYPPDSVRRRSGRGVTGTNSVSLRVRSPGL